jgi:hypothetical protein
MKKYIRKALILFVACIVLFATLDFIFRELKPVIHYLSQGAVFTALIIILNYFEDKRRNSKKNREGYIMK